MVKTSSQTLYMHDGKGARARVDYLPPNQPNVGLGYLLCPNGNQHLQFETLYYQQIVQFSYHCLLDRG